MGRRLVAAAAFVASFAVPAFAGNPLGAPDDYLLIGLPNRFGPLDPSASFSLQTRQVLSLVYEPLVRMNGKQELEPLLASSWTVSPRDRTIRMKIRKGVRFSDGSALGAEDVRRSLRAACRPKTPSSVELGGLRGCGKDAGAEPFGVTVVAPDTLDFRLEAAPTLFLYELATPRAGIRKLSPDGKISLGSGAYTVVRESPDTIVLAKNLRYRRADSVRNPGLVLTYMDETHLDRSVASLHPDATIMFRVPNTASIRSPDYRVLDEAANVTLKLVFNNGRFPFDRAIVRRAILAELYNQDRVYRCLPGNKKAYGIIPLGMGGSRAHVAPATLPEVKPQAVFAAVPELTPGRKPVKVKILRHLGRKNDCEETAVRDALKKYNIDATMEYDAEYKTLWPRYTKHDFDAFIELFVFVNREAYTKLIYYLSDGPENLPNVKLRKLDRAIEASWSSSESLSRFHQYGKVNDILNAEAVVVPLYYTNSRNLLHRCIDDLPEDFLYDPFLGLSQIYRNAECRRPSR